jgi:hypothetical protein
MCVTTRKITISRLTYVLAAISGSEYKSQELQPHALFRRASSWWISVIPQPQIVLTFFTTNNTPVLGPPTQMDIMGVFFTDEPIQLVSAVVLKIEEHIQLESAAVLKKGEHIQLESAAVLKTNEHIQLESAAVLKTNEQIFDANLVKTAACNESCGILCNLETGAHTD